MKTYKDIYEFPLKMYGGSHIWDNKDQMVAQFIVNSPIVRNGIIDILNGATTQNVIHTYKHQKGTISTEDNREIILIRGWGNLTGIGGHNLSDEEACNIQDTFAEFIVNKLNNKDNEK